MTHVKDLWGLLVNVQTQGSKPELLQVHRSWQWRSKTMYTIQNYSIYSYIHSELLLAPNLKGHFYCNCVYYTIFRQEYALFKEKLTLQLNTSGSN